MDSLPQNFQELFDKALPPTGRDHVLALGEDHTFSEHWVNLAENLTALKNGHGVGTIGVELPPYLNLFFWAYQDGTLARLTGSQEQARQYIHQLFYAIDSHKEEGPFADLVIKALDMGIRVVAYDSRFILSEQRDRTKVPRDEMFSTLPWNTFDRLRQNTDDFQTFMKHAASYRYPWVVYEADLLASQKPEYQRRLGLMEEMIYAGRERKIGTDAMSATLFHAAKQPGKQCITVIGQQHMSGFGVESEQAGLVHGTFSHHLERLRENWTKKPPKITRAVVASTGMLRSINEIMQPQIDGHKGPYIRASEPIIVGRLETDTTELMPGPAKGDRRGRDIEDVMPPHRVNPLSDPTMREIAKKIAADFNGRRR